MNLLKRLLVDAGMSQAAFGRVSDLCESHVSNVASRGLRPGPATLARIADAAREHLGWSGSDPTELLKEATER